MQAKFHLKRKKARPFVSKKTLRFVSSYLKSYVSSVLIALLLWQFYSELFPGPIHLFGRYQVHSFHFFFALGLLYGLVCSQYSLIRSVSQFDWNHFGGKEE